MQATQTSNPQTTEAPEMRNGVNVTGLMQTVQAVQQDPTLADCKFRVSNRWISGPLNRSTIGAFYACHQENERRQPLVYVNDEPPLLLGEDRGGNPVEYLLHALAGCMTTTMAYHAASRGIEIESIQSQLEGDIDLNGLLQTRPGTPSGYQQIRVTFKVKTEGDAALLKQLCQLSPVFDTLRRPVDLQIDVQTV